jgi:hypothetical protein
MIKLPSLMSAADAIRIGERRPPPVLVVFYWCRYL